MEPKQQMNFMVEWEYVYTYFGDTWGNVPSRTETRTTGRQFETLNDVITFIKENTFEKEEDPSLEIHPWGKLEMLNIRVFKLNKLEAKLDFDIQDEQCEVTMSKVEYGGLS